MREEALRYHAEGQSGKIAVVPTKPLASQHDFSLAYSPGVAEPCLEIVKNPLDAYKYTGKGNLVAVITNGTAVLGLGNIGALAGKPVMEGKSMLFKVFADIDAFDIDNLPDDKIVVMCTGSQGEPLSALSRMANGEHKTLSIHEGDTVILSATPVPGNEKAVQQVVNSLAKLGCDVWDKNRALVHVSGHGSQEELKLLMAMAKPTYFMPVHGEAVHLRAHAQLARKMGIKDDHIFSFYGRSKELMSNDRVTAVYHT